MLWMMMAALAQDAEPMSRADAARARLETDEAGRLMLEAITAHGGLDTWLDAGTVVFDFDYYVPDAPEKRKFTTNIVDIQTSRVRQTEVVGEAVLGWDGEQAWITPNAEAFPAPARFWALTPYYFVGVPFVFADPGTNISLEGPVSLPVPEGEPLETLALKVTYDPGVGEAPDDYYILHLDPLSKRAVALRYIVTSPTLFPDGGRTGETVLYYSRFHTEPQTGISYPQRYDGYHFVDGAPTEKKSEVSVTSLSFGIPVTDDTFAPPASP